MLNIVAIITANEDSVDLVKSEMMKMVPETLKEGGCFSYTLHQDIENPNTFVFYETWDSEESLQKHLKTPHVQNYISATKGCIASFSMKRLNKIA